MQVWSLDQKDPLENEIATHSSILAWEILWTEEAGGLQSMGFRRVGDNSVIKPPPPPGFSSLHWATAQSCPTLCDPMDGCTPSNEYSELISFRMDWLDLLAVQGILKSLLQHHSSKASILQCSAFFMVQLLYPYMINGKTKALTRQTFVSKVISLLFNMLFRLVIAFLPRSKHLLISWLQSPSAVILEQK